MSLQEIFNSWLALPEIDLRTLDEYLDDMCELERERKRLNDSAMKQALERAQVILARQKEIDSAIASQKYRTTNGPSVETGDMKWARN